MVTARDQVATLLAKKGTPSFNAGSSPRADRYGPAPLCLPFCCRLARVACRHGRRLDSLPRMAPCLPSCLPQACLGCRLACRLDSIAASAKAALPWTRSLVGPDVSRIKPWCRFLLPSSRTAMQQALSPRRQSPIRPPPPHQFCLFSCLRLFCLALLCLGLFCLAYTTANYIPTSNNENHRCTG